MDPNRPITRKTGQLLHEHRLHLKKSLGQNFITDSRVLDKMLAAAQIDLLTGVLEIGPGLGALTERLAQAAATVVAVEIDSRFIPILSDMFQDQDHVMIKQGDILKLDVNKLMDTYMQGVERTCVVANLPYYVTSPVIMRMLECRWPFENMVFMVQKEVAERMISPPGTKAYGLLSVAVQYYARVERVANVPTHVFIPRPNVSSAVIKLTPHTTPSVQVASTAHFFSIVRAGFRERRKTLANNLAAHIFDGWRKSQVVEWLTEQGIDPSRRAETLTLEEFANLSNAFDRLDTKGNSPF